MTHCYAACMLLDLGPLTFQEFREIAGWPRGVAGTILRRLRRRGYVRHFAERGTNRYLYELTR